MLKGLSKADHTLILVYKWKFLFKKSRSCIWSNNVVIFG